MEHSLIRNAARLRRKHDEELFVARFYALTGILANRLAPGSQDNPVVALRREALEPLLIGLLFRALAAIPQPFSAVFGMEHLDKASFQALRAFVAAGAGVVPYVGSSWHHKADRKFLLRFENGRCLVTVQRASTDRTLAEIDLSLLPEIYISSAIVDGEWFRAHLVEGSPEEYLAQRRSRGNESWEMLVHESLAHLGQWDAQVGRKITFLDLLSSQSLAA